MQHRSGAASSGITLVRRMSWRASAASNAAAKRSASSAVARDELVHGSHDRAYSAWNSMPCCIGDSGYTSSIVRQSSAARSIAACEAGRLREREVARRRTAAAPRDPRRARVDELAQRARKAFGERIDGRALELRRAVHPVQLQRARAVAVGVEVRVNRQRIAERPVRVALDAGAAEARHQQRRAARRTGRDS
jgi:hypothetical protein